MPSKTSPAHLKKAAMLSKRKNVVVNNSAHVHTDKVCFCHGNTCHSFNNVRLTVVSHELGHFVTWLLALLCSGTWAPMSWNTSSCLISSSSSSPMSPARGWLHQMLWNTHSLLPTQETPLIISSPREACQVKVLRRQVIMSSTPNKQLVFIKLYQFHGSIHIQCTILSLDYWFLCCFIGSRNRSFPSFFLCLTCREHGRSCSFPHVKCWQFITHQGQQSYFRVTQQALLTLYHHCCPSFCTNTFFFVKRKGCREMLNFISFLFLPFFFCKYQSLRQMLPHVNKYNASIVTLIKCSIIAAPWRICKWSCAVVRHSPYRVTRLWLLCLHGVR